MNKLVLLSILLGFFVSLDAQKTIFELLEISREGCSLAAPQTREQPASLTMMEEVPEDFILEEEEHQLPTDYTSVQQVKDVVSEWVRSEKEADKPFLEGRINWRDGFVFFLRDGKWGLRKKSGKVKIKPRFDHVLVDTTMKGFVAYVNGRANYYSNKGKSYLSEDYLEIRPLPQGVFIVKTSKGFGLLDDQGQTLIEPEQRSIYPLNNDSPYLRIGYDENNSYWLNLNTGQQTYLPSYYYNLTLLGEHHALVGQRSLIDLRNNKEMFCGKELTIRVIDKEKGYLSINDTATPERKYLINLQGELISQEAFDGIGAYLPTGHFVVRKKKIGEEGAPVFAGVIDDQGKWTIRADYVAIGPKLHAEKYLEVSFSDGTKRLVTLEEKFITTAEQYFHIEEQADSGNLKLLWKKEGITHAALLDLETEELTKLTEPGYWRRALMSNCEGTVTYRAIGVEGQMLIDDAGQPLLKEPAGFIMKGNDPGSIIIKRKRIVNGRRVNVDEIVDCSGQPFASIAQETQMEQIDEDFFFLKKASGERLFLLLDGTEVPSTSNWKQHWGQLGENHFVMIDEAGFRGVINRQGEVVLPPILENIYLDRAKGLLSASIMGQRTYFQADGSEFPGGEYQAVEYAGLHLYRVQQNNRWGLIDRTGKLIVPVEYNRIYVGSGEIRASRFGREKMVFDLMGRKKPKI